MLGRDPGVDGAAQGFGGGLHGRCPARSHIFYNNCFKNGILPIKVSAEDLEKLFDDANRDANATLTVDLEAQTKAPMAARFASRSTRSASAAC